MFSAVARKSVRSVASVPVRQVAFRSFASAPEITEDLSKHRPVLSLHGLAARYANATYVAASKSNMLDKVEGELSGLMIAAMESPAFKGFLENPLIPRDEKSAQIEKLLKEKKVSTITINLCTTLAGNARLSELPKVATTFGQLMKAKRGQVDATIISADPLSKKETDQIAAAIKATSKGAKEVLISSKVDPEIIGGIQVQIGDQFLDLSIRSRIEEISRTPV
jgi:F-type H+-transporting ATPase subunit O